MKVSARVSRDGKFWLVRVPEIGQCTQVRSLREVPEMVADLVAVWEDIDVESVEVGEVVVEFPSQVRRELDRASEMSESARRAQAAAAEASRRSVAAMRELGWSVRDIAAALGVSHQRVSQLAKGATSAGVGGAVSPVVDGDRAHELVAAATGSGS